MSYEDENISEIYEFNEDLGHPNNYYSDFNSDISSINTEYIKQQKILSEYKKTDKGYNIVKKKIGKEVVKIEFYDTNYTPKTIIRNAVTGSYQRGCLVGSNDENLFFKVSNACAENHNRDPKILFYDDPEQFERHFKVTCSVQTKELWKAKYIKEIKKKRDKQKLERNLNVTSSVQIK